MELLCFQKEVCDRIEREYNFKCLLAASMGMGKGVMATELIKRKALPLNFVICPAHIKYYWVNTLKSHLGKGWKVHLVESSDDNLLLLRGYKHVVVMSYNIFSKKWLYMLYKGCGVVFDESHYLKDLKSERTKKALSFVHAVKPELLLLLTGTPILNNPMDLWPQITMINDKVFPSLHKYVQEFTIPRKTRWGVDFSRAKNINKLHKILIKSKVMLRITWEDVDFDLPEQTRVIIPIVTPKDEIKELIDEIERTNKQIHISKYRQLIGEMKLKPSLEFIKSKLSEVDRIVVFAYHRNITTTLAKELSKVCDARLIIGGISSKKKHEAEVWFNKNDGKKKVIVANIDAGGTGLNLPEADCVVFVELDWTPAKLEQAEKRAQRLNSKKSSVVFYLISDDKIERAIVNTLNRKQKTISKIIDNKTKRMF